jgi:uncharacterized membrane protein YozB (DUF420 family)
MLTIFGAKVSIEALAFFVLFLASEYLGATKRYKSNGVVQALTSAANYFKLFRKEDDKIEQIKRILKG